MRTELRSALWRILKLLALLYVFFLSIDLLSSSFKMFGGGFADHLMAITANPLVGLCIGILVTSLVQSSSVTTSTVVGMVAVGSMSIRNAIPIIMGANIGTTVTCVIVAIAHVTRGREFQRAYSAASVHDMFNLLSVLVLLPLEVSTHFIEHACEWWTDLFVGFGGVKFVSPLKRMIKPVADLLAEAVVAVFHDGTIAAAVALLLLALVLLALALKYLSSTIKAVMVGRVEKLVNNYLFARPLRALALGTVLTALVQSSSVTTSLVVPMVAGGIFTLEAVFPFMLGANIGTTVTALLASLASMAATGSPAGVTIALAHLMFNCCGTLVWYPLRKVPILLARKLAWLAANYKTLAIVYVLTIFYAIPLVIVFLLR